MPIDDPLPTLARDRGPNVIAAKHVAPAVVEQVAARAAQLGSAAPVGSSAVP